MTVASITHQGSSQIGFRRHSASEQSLSFTNRLSDARSVSNRILENGSGVALEDVNGDSLPDVYLAALEGENRLYLNRGGFHFDHASPGAPIACPGQFSTGVLFADVDGDLDSDLLVASLDHSVRLFLNDGIGGFTERMKAGFSDQTGSTSLTAGDVDLDGDVDLYVAHYRETTVKDESLRLNLRREEGLWILPESQKKRFISTRNLNGRGILLEQGLPDALYLNDGDGFFSPVAWTDGFFLDEAGQSLDSAPLDWTLSVSFADVNRDGYPDLYVCSDFISPDRFWLNQKGTGFQAVSRSALSFSSWSSMCVDWADLNLDGHWDFFVGDMLSRSHLRRHYQRANHTPNAWTDWAFEQRRQYMRNTLFLNRGDQTFSELARFAGLQASEWTWNCAWMDVDRDGREDLLITNGHPHDSLDSDWTGKISALTSDDPSARLQLPALKTANLAFRNSGQLTFEELGADWGFSSTTFGQGMALGDLDGDGDREIVVNALNSSVEIYENIGHGALISVRLRELRKGKTAVGALITLTGGGITQMRELRAGGRYLSSDSNSNVFGVSDLGDSFHLQVKWNDGLESEWSDIRPNSVLTVTRLSEPVSPENTSIPRRVSSDSVAQTQSPLFENLSAELGLTHRDDPFDDDTVQVSLTEQLSDRGMALGWFDGNGNRWDDILLGGGANDVLKWALNVRGQEWSLGQMDDQRIANGDQVSLSSVGSGRFIIAESGYEKDTQSRQSGVDVLALRTGQMERLNTISVGGAISSVVSGDVDRDGDLDVFVGGRFEIGRYPESARSTLLMKTPEGLRPFEGSQEWFEDLGMVTGAVFCHLNGDSWIDLAVAVEWGGVRVYLNQEGVLEDQTKKLGLDRLSGLWQSLDCGDFNGDGRLDLVLGNWGRNRFPVPQLDRPIRLYYGESNERGDLVSFEAHYSETRGGYVPVLDRNRCLEIIPEMVNRFPSYRSFGESVIEEILSPHLKTLAYLEASTLDSLVLLQTDEGVFNIIALPWEAQISPVFGLSVADFDGDAREDLFLSQNFYGTELPVAPFDAGLGLILKGQGNGKFVATSSQESGIRVRGSGRGSAVSDYDRDGRWDLLVGRHNRQTGLFRNRQGRPGIRVRLRIDGENEDGIGALLRLCGEEHCGPVRMLIGGGGDGAQDSVQPILYCNTEATRLWVQWPDGHETETDLPKKLVSVWVREDGSIKEFEK